MVKCGCLECAKARARLALSAAAKTLIAPRTRPDPAGPIETYLDSCIWAKGTDGEWQTGCGNAWCFETGGPEENKTHYCMYCGKWLVISRPSADREKGEV